MKSKHFIIGQIWIYRQRNKKKKPIRFKLFFLFMSYFDCCLLQHPSICLPAKLDELCLKLFVTLTIGTDSGIFNRILDVKVSGIPKPLLGNLSRIFSLYKSLLSCLNLSSGWEMLANLVNILCLFSFALGATWNFGIDAGGPNNCDSLNGEMLLLLGAGLAGAECDLEEAAFQAESHKQMQIINNVTEILILLKTIVVVVVTVSGRIHHTNSVVTLILCIHMFNQSCCKRRDFNHAIQEVIDTESIRMLFRTCRKCGFKSDSNWPPIQKGNAEICIISSTSRITGRYCHHLVNRNWYIGSLMHPIYRTPIFSIIYKFTWQNQINSDCLVVWLICGLAAKIWYFLILCTRFGHGPIWCIQYTTFGI